MKVIFLDIDGVMNSELYARKQWSKRWLRLETYFWWIKSKVKFVLNGFENKGVCLKDIAYPKDFYTFKYKFARLKSQTDPIAWKFLAHLIEDTNAKICISSVWKRHFDNYTDWNMALVLLGLPVDTFIGITGARRMLRGSEINEWLQDHPTIDSYAIIDDDDDMLEEQIPSFFKTDGYCGLSPNICYQIKNHLNR